MKFKSKVLKKMTGQVSDEVWSLLFKPKPPSKYRVLVCNEYNICVIEDIENLDTESFMRVLEKTRKRFNIGSDGQK